MSKMCKMNSSCKAAHGMYVHEKMMLGMALLAAAAIAYWLFA